MNLMATVLPPDVGNSFPSQCFPRNLHFSMLCLCYWKGEKMSESGHRASWSHCVQAQWSQGSSGPGFSADRKHGGAFSHKWFLLGTIDLLSTKSRPVHWGDSAAPLPGMTEISGNGPHSNTHTHSYIWVMTRGVSLLISKPLLPLIACHWEGKWMWAFKSSHHWWQAWTRIWAIPKPTAMIVPKIIAFISLLILN